METIKVSEDLTTEMEMVRPRTPKAEIIRKAKAKRKLIKKAVAKVPAKSEGPRLKKAPKLVEDKQAVAEVKAAKAKKVKASKERHEEKKTEGRKSISRMVFGFIMENGLLEADNRKERYAELEALVKAEFPESKFQRTHFYWYLARAARQQRLGLPTDRIVMPKEGEAAA